MKPHADIPELLDRYWAGETTLDEERRLKAFFDAETVPEQFRTEAPFFKALRAEQAVQYAGKPSKTQAIRSLNSRFFAAAAAVLALLCASLFWWAGGPEPAPIAQIQPAIEDAKPERSQPEPAQSPAASEAAPTLARASANPKPRAAKPGKKPPTVQTEPAREISEAEAEAALAEIKAALALVSSKINRSKQTLDKGLQEVEHIDIFHKKKPDTNG